MDFIGWVLLFALLGSCGFLAIAVMLLRNRRRQESPAPYLPDSFQDYLRNLPNRLTADDIVGSTARHPGFGNEGR
jgi:hypothetical protein